MEKLTSIHNQHVKNWKKLQTKKYRRQTGTYLLDGWHLVNEATQAGNHLLQLIGTEEQLRAYSELQEFSDETYEVTEEVMQHITDTVTPQGIAAVVSLPDAHKIPDSNTLRGGWLFLDRVQDPGNVGTMVRTADAAGFTGVVVSHRSADIFGPKVIRSMQGSQFHLKLYEGNLEKWIEDFKKINAPVYGTQLNPQAKSFRDVEPGETFALIMGNEGQGMSQHLLNQTTDNLYIPMRGQAESLNVAISAGILMFQLNKNL
ncbi:TrmH family RNA methyltransferase [Limosilactobacillus fastidiosus]|uniref:RNA methyltransferase n=1 Tax=Limosilactobacillus fastidiosus TaxID=2759855 RepID=A0A7W3U172_9LACO|nr:RNA methyltransferase [Limosilactobacillus fastidiosus]MBB1063706.1 RNA methyltransferase [Limosilactobacillus fastidiosus]MBB1086765.1 RNA methyltransferase [Limosilactobacillus fastidiosus]MCD7084281.1 RNA methyltransferase [Limosilactobacillus fastidiosus]MCD7085508.1 RNA methyltransferase [Limosilactobacillus fastidiosus]MCD7114739.1 RNA methyltransferase [Limosilactobacillus fastidiosus]